MLRCFNPLRYRAMTLEHSDEICSLVRSQRADTVRMLNTSRTFSNRNVPFRFTSIAEWLRLDAVDDGTWEAVWLCGKCSPKICATSKTTDIVLNVNLDIFTRIGIIYVEKKQLGNDLDHSKHSGDHTRTAPTSYCQFKIFGLKFFFNFLLNKYVFYFIFCSRFSLGKPSFLCVPLFCNSKSLKRNFAQRSTYPPIKSS